MLRNGFLESLAKKNESNPKFRERLEELESLEEKLFRTPEDVPEFRTEKNTFLRDSAPLFTSALTEMLRSKLLSGSPEALMFDDSEKLFVDFGWFSERLCPEVPSPAKCPETIFPLTTVCGWLEEAFSDVFGTFSTSSSEKTLRFLNLKITALLSKLGMTGPLVLSGGEGGVSRNDAETMFREWGARLGSYARVSAKTREWRDGDEETRASLAGDSRKFIELTERIRMFLSAKESTDREVVARVSTMLYECRCAAVQAAHVSREHEKRLKRRERFEKKFSGDALAAKTFLLDLPRSKSEYAALMSKRVRRNYTPFMDSDAGKTVANLSCIPDAEQSVLLADMGLLEAPRIRMYGLPRTIVFPGGGVGAYDWSDNTILLPVSPSSGNVLKALVFAFASFRWDTDEERMLKDTYNKLKANKKKNIVDLANSFATEYFLWVTKESKGYRILPGESHKWFSRVFADKLDIF